MFPQRVSRKLVELQLQNTTYTAGSSEFKRLLATGTKDPIRGEKHALFSELKKTECYGGYLRFIRSLTFTFSFDVLIWARRRGRCEMNVPRTSNKHVTLNTARHNASTAARHLIPALAMLPRNSRESRSRKSRQMESVRVSVARARANGSAEESHESRMEGGDSRDDLECSTGNDSSLAVERSNPMKHELFGLNHRLISYMNRVKQNETLLMKAEGERQTIRKQLEKNREEHNQQIEMLRLQLDEHVQQAVTAKEKQAHMERRLQKFQEERKNLKAELKVRRQREASLERALITEKNEIREARSKIVQLENDAIRNEELRSQMSEEITKLKVENAKLHERMKIANMELTMQESKASEAEKQLQFTSEDVKKKLHEQRVQLEKLGMEKLEEFRRQQQAEVLRLKKDHEIDKQNALVTYVSAEDYAKLDTQRREYARKLEETELLLRDREEKLREAEERINNLTTDYEKKLTKERKRGERLQRKLAERDTNQDDIRNELEKYRKLIDGLDMNENFMLNTPLGVKRPRSSHDLDLASPLNPVTKLPENPEAPVVAANKEDTRRILTPRPLRTRKAPTTTAERAKNSENEDTATLQRDCRMM